MFVRGAGVFVLLLPIRLRDVGLTGDVVGVGIA